MENLYLVTSRGTPSASSLLLRLAAEKNAQVMRGKTVEEHREALDILADVRLSRPINRVEEVECAGVPCQWISRPDSLRDKVVLYIHGGSWAFGNLKTARAAGIHICEKSGVRVLAVAYRLSPEHPYPAGLEDCLGVYHWLRENGYAPEDIGLFGDSAGGNLSLALLLRLRERGEPLPAGAALASPVVDMTDESRLVRDRSDLIFTLWEGEERDIFSLYAGDANRELPELSPIRADLTGLPPLLIHVGEEESMVEDCAVFAGLAHAQGVKIRVKVWRGMFHDFSVVGHALKESRLSMREFGKFFRRLFAV